MNLKSNVSVGGIRRLIDEVRRYRQDLNRQVNKVVGDMVSEGAELARAECPVNTGELYSSIVGITDHALNKGFIRVNCPYAVYVEMGTGVEGDANPHPDTSILGFEVKYDRNGHGQAGWWYYDEQGKLRWTRGTRSKPFMYNAAQELKRRHGGG